MPVNDNGRASFIKDSGRFYFDTELNPQLDGKFIHLKKTGRLEWEADIDDNPAGDPPGRPVLKIGGNNVKRQLYIGLTRAEVLANKDRAGDYTLPVNVAIDSNGRYMVITGLETDIAPPRQRRTRRNAPPPAAEVANPLPIDWLTSKPVPAPEPRNAIKVYLRIARQFAYHVAANVDTPSFDDVIRAAGLLESLMHDIERDIGTADFSTVAEGFAAVREYLE